MNSVHDIKVFKLKTIKNPKGNVLRAFRETDKYAGKSVEIYFSWINRNKVKGWKLHKLMTMNLVVPVGLVKFVFFDGKYFKKIIIGEKNYSRIFVPRKLFFAFQNLSTQKSLIVNNASIIHKKKNEIISKDLSEIEYKWKI